VAGAGGGGIFAANSTQAALRTSPDLTCDAVLAMRWSAPARGDRDWPARTLVPAAFCNLEGGGTVSERSSPFANTDGGTAPDRATSKGDNVLDFRRPSKAMQDVVAGGGAGLRLLSVRNMLALEGGVPVIVDGKVVGAVGVSGVTSEQDAQVAMAGAAAAKQLPRQRSFAWVPVIDSGAAYARHCESAPDAQQCLAPPFAAW
jgi:uncharacterized protein GlcG (DUF336 family)